MASYGVLEEHTTLDLDFSILATAFCWACGLSWNEAWAMLDIPMSEYNVSATFNVTDLSPFDVGGDLRAKSFSRGGE